VSVPVERLAEVFEFTLAELEENRAGRVHEDQKPRLMAAVRDLAQAGSILLGIGLALALIVPTVFVLTGAPSGPYAHNALLLGIGIPPVVSGAFWGPGIYFRIRGRQLRTAIAAGRVRVSEGPITRWYTSSKGGFVTYFARVGNVEIKLPNAGPDEMSDGERYRLYSVPHARGFLALEPASAEDPT
jgi:hypothetical protein